MPKKISLYFYQFAFSCGLRIPEVFMVTYSSEWKFKKKFGETAIRKFAGPQSDLHDAVMKEVGTSI